MMVIPGSIVRFRFAFQQDEPACIFGPSFCESKFSINKMPASSIYKPSLTVFVPFAWLYLKEKPMMKEKPVTDYLRVGLCLLGAAFFIFRKKTGL